MANRVRILLAGLAGLGAACGQASSDRTSAAGGAPTGGAGGLTAGNMGEAGRATGGSSGSGNGATGGKGQAGGAATGFGDTATEACVAYARAVCKRQAECQGGGGDFLCADAGRQCPDTTASPGSTRTVADLKTCALTYETLACDLVNAATYPACVTPGQRAIGESCMFPSQCSTLNCKFTAQENCGKCARTVGIGESCAADDANCGGNGYCTTTEQVCLDVTSTTPEPTQAGANQPCSLNTPCIEDYYCPPGTNPLCSPLPRLGQSCATLDCATDSYCVEDATGAHVCGARPGLAEPCASALGGPLPYPYICRKDLLCSYTSPTEGTCLPWPEPGEPCNIPPSNPSYGRCANGVRCNFAATPPVCATIGKLGDACESSRDCEPGVWCGCPESNPVCDPRVCVRLKFGGEPCGTDTTSACHSAFDCKAGSCQPAELRGVFAAACE